MYWLIFRIYEIFVMFLKKIKINQYIYIYIYIYIFNIQAK